MERDKRGYWKPVDKIEYQPVFKWPLDLKKIFIYFFALPGFFGLGIFFISFLLLLHGTIYHQQYHNV